MKNTVILFFLCFTSHVLTAQNVVKTKPKHHFSLQWLGWTYHPENGGSMPQNYPWKLDAKASVVLNPGIAISYDWAWKKHFFWRAAAGYYGDCALLPAGYLHFGFRWEALRFGRHSFNGGLGPGFLFRKDWHQFAAYRGDLIYGERVYEGWQYRLTPIIGEVEYIYQINDNLAFQYSVLPAYPAVIVSKIGVRWALK
jgi:hypothetical protein